MKFHQTVTLSHTSTLTGAESPRGTLAEYPHPSTGLVTTKVTALGSFRRQIHCPQQPAVTDFIFTNFYPQQCFLIAIKLLTHDPTWPS